MTAEGKPAANRLIPLIAGAVVLFGCGFLGATLRGLRERPATSTASASPHQDVGSRGRVVFQVYCARCHGPEGHGDGPDSAAIKPPPRDLTASASWRSPPTEASVRRAVVEGIPGTMMAGLGASLSPGEVNEVVRFALSLAPVSKGPFEKAGFTAAIVGTVAPPLPVHDLDGQALDSGWLRGKLVLVVFWGTSCAPCVKELPEVARLADTFRDKGLVVIPVCADETDADTVRRVAAGYAPGLPVYVDPKGMAKLQYDVQALPSSYWISPEGRLLGQGQGATDWSSPETAALLKGFLTLH